MSFFMDAWNFIEQNSDVIFAGFLMTGLSFAGLGYYIVQKERSIAANAITANRIKWIEDVRKLLGDFICAYLDGESKEELLKIESRIELYCRETEAYLGMVRILRLCCQDDAYDSEHYKTLIAESQEVLGAVWARIKVEGGMDIVRNDRIVDKVKKYGFIGK